MIKGLLGAAGEVLALPAYQRAMARRGRPEQFTTLAYGKHGRQYLLHRPALDSAAPVAVWVHGGGWQFGSPDRLLGFGTYFHRRGYHVYLVSHRRIPRFGGSSIVQDLEAALRLIDSRHPNGHLLLGGVSSGGHLATLCALRQNTWRHRLQLQGLITCAAPLSLQDLAYSPVLHRVAGRASSRQFAKLDPLVALDHTPDFPALMIHGTADGLVPYRSAQRFWRKAENLGWAGLSTQTLLGGSHIDAGRWVFEE